MAENVQLRATQSRLLKRYVWSLAAGWTLVIAALFLIIADHERRQTLEIARTQARSNYQRDVIYRHWVAHYGGVYVPVTGDTKAGGVRKVRWNRRGTGKSGGVRVLYFARTEAGEIWLLLIYAKSAIDSIQGHILKALKEEMENATR